ncbi:triphosphoribosyl-dephospho-CoA synthase [Jiella sonneratiae]|uniref:Triphosphoribosyl-dephospho-CoA synthase n=1 Tax=Jiella sonneratiae TaxID=2816856 RepID=A0ABS3IZ06_9HYPH|nr:triphosphoribosyl-dephospho-CoA synthase [Jiella sonneratiae]MBO0902643.1 triphosphoribosyl-dephospho-CoA synthase [Jiella sonneratiae]
MRLGPEAIARSFLAACRAEIETLKPGNVHRFAPGHGMTVATFLDAAAAAAPAVAAPASRVGRRILTATEASFSAVGMNANLGIVLLCAPLAAAAEQVAAEPTSELSHAEATSALRRAVAGVLAGLDAEDARLAFQAIALASPGGLGARAEHDVRTAPTIGLVAAMALAADVDLVARQYVDGYREVFETGLAAVADSAGRGAPEPLGDPAALAAFLAFAATFPDGHLARKFGPKVAEDCRKRFRSFTDRLGRIAAPQARLDAALAFDAALKFEGRNPGTSADLTVATLFANELAQALAG